MMTEGINLPSSLKANAMDVSVETKKALGDGLYRALSSDDTVVSVQDWTKDSWRFHIGTLQSLVQAGKNLESAESICLNFIRHMKEQNSLGAEALLIGEYTLAILRTKQKQWYKAETLLTQCYASSRDAMGLKHQLTLSVMSLLGECKLYIGDYEAAELLLEDCLKGQIETLGEKHKDSLATMFRLGGYYNDLGHYTKAEGCFNKCYTYLCEIHGRTDPVILPSLMKLGSVYNIERKFKLADETFNLYLSLCRELKMTEHTEYMMALKTLANIMYVQWDYESALPLFKEISNAVKAKEGENSVSHLEVLNSLSLVYLRMQRYAEAESAFLTCLTVGTELLGENHPLVNTWRGNYELAVTEAEESRRSGANSRATSRASSRGSSRGSRKGSKKDKGSGKGKGSGTLVGDEITSIDVGASGGDAAAVNALKKTASSSSLRPSAPSPSLKEAVVVEDMGSTACTIC